VVVVARFDEGFLILIPKMSNEAPLASVARESTIRGLIVLDRDPPIASRLAVPNIRSSRKRQPSSVSHDDELPSTRLGLPLLGGNDAK
jgi:hypothetical protein